MKWYEKIKLDRYFIIDVIKEDKEGNIKTSWTTTNFIDEHEDLSSIAIIDLRYIEKPQILVQILKIYNLDSDFIEWLFNFLTTQEQE